MNPEEKKIWSTITNAEEPMSFAELREATGTADETLLKVLRAFMKIGFIVRDLDTGRYRLPYAMVAREMYAQNTKGGGMGLMGLYPYVDWGRLDLMKRSKEIQGRAKDATSAAYVFGEFLKSKTGEIDRDDAFMDIWESSVYQLYGIIKFLLDIVVSTNFEDVQGKEQFHRNVLEILKTNMDEYFFPVLQSLVYFVFKNSDVLDDDIREWWSHLEIKV
ncbi:hypothetical protein JXL21_02470 [Candidatus Bathyarchaeota archaeon]|nr:hypothetical protein [Candidatus Bathyarchaeota archaeon]